MIKNQDFDVIDDFVDLFRLKWDLETIKFSFLNKKYFLTKDYSNFQICKSFQIKKRYKSLTLFFAKVQYEYVPGRNSSGVANELQGFLFVQLKNDYGHQIIKRETLLEKIIEIFQPLELDFPDDSQFSRMFYVLSKDESKARQFLTEKMRRQIKTLVDIDPYIEILNHHVLICNKKGLGDNSIERLAEFGIDIADSL